MSRQVGNICLLGSVVAIAIGVAGPALAHGTTERVNLGPGGVQANTYSQYVSLSADGRFVAFNTGASNLVSGDTNELWDVFVRDRQTGTTRRVSVGTGGGGQSNDYTYTAEISANGRIVAFESLASNLVLGDTNETMDVFVHDRKTGVTQRVSLGLGVQAKGPSFSPSVSAGGRFVAFNSYASNLVPGDTNNLDDVFVRDRQTGTTQRVNVGTGGNQANSGSGRPAISADGRFVAYTSPASNLVPGDTNHFVDVFVRDREKGITERASVGPGSVQGDRDSDQYPAISADGRFVAFSSYARNLVPGDTNNEADVFVRDRQNGTTQRVNVGRGGVQANGLSGHPSISADGRLITFDSEASNLVSDDTNGRPDVFVHDRRTGTTRRVSVRTGGGQGNGNSPFHSAFPAMSADGRAIAFESDDSNLVPGDTNETTDVFVRILVP